MLEESHPAVNRRGDAYTVFSTAIGDCAVAWSKKGLVRAWLPDARAGEDLAAGSGAPRQAPPDWVKDAIVRITRLLEGHDEDLSAIPLDLDGLPPFHRKVYEAARHIGRGQIRTYGQVAAEVGSPGAFRAVGQALAKNPIPIVVPCHRVVAAGGKPGGFSAPGGLDTKARLLAIEGLALRH